MFTDSNGVQITPKLAVGSGGMSVIGDLNCEGTIRATVNMGCKGLWCSGVYGDTLQLGDKKIDGAWLNAIQRFYDKVNGGFDALRNAYNRHTHSFSVTGTAAAQTVTGTGTVPAGTTVAAAYYSQDDTGSGGFANVGSGSTVSGSFSSVRGLSGIQARVTVTAPAQQVTLSGTSSGPSPTA